AGGPPKATVTVSVRGGTYVLTDTLVFGPEDSGTPQRRMVYAAYPDETPVLTSGLTFRGFTFTQTAQVPLSQRDPKDTGTLDTNDCALLLQGAADCVIESCRFVETGGYGVRLKHAATGNRITENEFVGCGGGVLLTGYGPGTRD